ncbi:MAG: DUF6443 domain-containing protein, partial [Bacteroidota bacterium]
MKATGVILLALVSLASVHEAMAQFPGPPTPTGDGGTIYYRDQDRDSYGNPNNTRTVLDGQAIPIGYVSNNTDCDDTDARIKPTTRWYQDKDGDGYYGTDRVQCTRPGGSGWSLSAGGGRDCDDNSASVHPGRRWYQDADGDGYFGSSRTQCYKPSGAGWSSSSGSGSDCNDGNAGINPNTTWYYDRDGDGFYSQTKKQCQDPGAYWESSNNAGGGDCADGPGDQDINPGTVWYYDRDGDGFHSQTTNACYDPGAYWSRNYGRGPGDCADVPGNEDLNPNTVWYLDADLDGYYIDTKTQCVRPGNSWRRSASKGLGDCDDNNAGVGSTRTWYLDADNDGYYLETRSQCAAPGSGWRLSGVQGLGDCNDNDPNVGNTRIWYYDRDGDGYFSETRNQCADPGAYWELTYGIAGGDCADGPGEAYLNPSTTWYYDRDGDGFYSQTKTQCQDPGAYWESSNNAGGGDCADGPGDQDINPGTVWYYDRDGDGFHSQTTNACYDPGSYWSRDYGKGPGDCADVPGNEDLNPNTVWYLDADFDGYYIDTKTQCVRPGNSWRRSASKGLGDCDDNNAGVGSTRTWYLDGDGDGYHSETKSQCASPGPKWSLELAHVEVDCDDTRVDIHPGTVWYRDGDNDNFGVETDQVVSCEQPEGYALAAGDCNDMDPLEKPGMVWYQDADGDGYGDPSTAITSCTTPQGYVSKGDDCDDANELETPRNAWFRDSDDDGLGDYSTLRFDCTQPTGYVGNGLDCDDTDPAIKRNGPGCNILTITNVAAGDFAVVGSSVRLSWLDESNGATNFYGFFNDEPINGGEPFSGPHYDWMPRWTAANGVIRLVGVVDGAEVQVISEPFTVGAPIVVSFDNTVRYRPGGQIMISWTGGSPNTPFDVRIKKGVTTVDTYQGLTSTSMVWHIPADWQDGGRNFKVEVSQDAARYIGGGSKQLSEKSFELFKELKVLVPNDAERYEYGTLLNVSWEGEDPEQAYIISTIGPVSTHLATTSGNTFAWPIEKSPSLPEGEYRLRVTQGEYEDESDAVFQIVRKLPQLMAPQEGAFFDDALQVPFQLIWPVPGGDQVGEFQGKPYDVTITKDGEVIHQASDLQEPSYSGWVPQSTGVYQVFVASSDGQHDFKSGQFVLGHPLLFDVGVDGRYPGGLIPISWEGGVEDGTHTLSIHQGGQVLESITKGAGTSHGWLVPADIDIAIPLLVKVVQTKGQLQLEAQSELFELSAPVEISPLTATEVVYGDMINMAWSGGQRAGNFSLALLAADGSQILDLGTTTEKVFAWRAARLQPDGTGWAPPGQYRLRVKQGQLTDEVPFSMDFPAAEWLDAPAEAERVDHTLDYELTWVGPDTKEYEIFFDGTYIETITGNRHTWNVPEASGPGHWLDIYSRDGMHVYQSKLFEIINAAPCRNHPFAASDKNYVVTYTARAPLEGCIALVDDREQVSQSIAYMDGLGRQLQTIGVGASNSPTADLVQMFSYDSYGRQAKQYLPFPEVTGHGAFHHDAQQQQSSYYEANYPGNGASAFSQQVFEASPLNRVIETAAPGAAWNVESGHTVQSSYDINREEEGIRSLRFDRSSSSVVDHGVYLTGQLTKATIRDENEGPLEGVTIEFTDKRGQVILKMAKLEQQTDGPRYAKTYYVYDDFGNLAQVIQPEGVRRIETGEEDLDWSSINSEDFARRWIFSYRYDDLQRMVAKRVPGADWMHMVYDERDRLVLTQDGNQRGALTLPEATEAVSQRISVASYQGDNYYIMEGGSVELLPGFEVEGTGATHGVFEAAKETSESRQQYVSDQWQFTKYDALNRPIATGLTTIDAGDQSVEEHVNQHYLDDTSFFGETFTGDGSLEGYTNYTYPVVAAEDLLTLTYYDSYDWTNEPMPEGALSVVKGQVTGSKTRILSTNEWLTTVIFYDSRYRVIKTVSDHHVEGRDEVSTDYRNEISGLVKRTKRMHYGVQHVNITDEFTYDHMDRLLTATQTMNGQDTEPIVDNTYNGIGELLEKDLGGDLQSLDFSYNIRGWLQAINGGADAFDDPSDKFGMELRYHDADNGYEAYNGNIGQMMWKSLGGRSEDSKEYLYKYDAASRLKNGYYFVSDDPTQNNMYQVAGQVVDNVDQGIAYDDNGNIEVLRRRGPDPVTGNRVYLDDLRYEYNGNQLDHVNDVRGDGLFSEIHSDGAIEGEYKYDANGNMIVDANKGLEVTYNHLNLPEMVTFTHDPSKSVRYTYDAAGVKLTKHSISAAGTEVIDYVGDIHYKNGELDFVQHAEGRAVFDGQAYFYEYNLTDHLGNVRVVVAEPEVITMLATMETENATYDEQVFANVVETRAPDGVANHTPGGNEVARVNNEHPVGPFVALSVAPGDKVDLSVFAYFDPATPPGDPLPVESLVSALANSADPAVFGLEGGRPALEGRLQDALGSAAMVGDEESQIPRGYLNYMLYDEALNLLQGGFVQLTSAAAGALEELSIPGIEVTEVGYLMAYVSNESDISSFVSFDDFTVTHTTSGVKQTQDYYPFGLTFNEWTREPSNLYKFQGQEHQEETGWVQFKWRNHDPALARFFNVDPLAEDYYYNSPYAFSEN